jgi:cytochrome P450
MTHPSRCPIHHFDPFEATYLADPYQTFAWAHQEAPVFYSAELGYYVVTRHHDIKAILRDPERFSSRNATDPFTPVSPETAAIFRAGGYAMQRVLLNADGTTHQRIRRHVYAAFTPQRVATLEPRIRQATRQMLDAIVQRNQHHVDIMAECLYTLPARVIFLLIGMSDAEIAAIKSGSESRVVFTWGKPTATQQAELAKTMVEFWQIAEAFVAKRAAQPADDFTSDLIRTRGGDDDVLSMGEITSVVFGLLLAGHETTTGLLGNAVRRLLEIPERWQQLYQHPEQLPAAIEELLRYDTSVIAMRRWSTQACTIGGYDIPADANLLLLIGAGNRDALQFDHSDQFDWHRANNRDHLSFGFGSHYCIGAPLARLEARIVLAELLAAFPQARLATPQTYDYLPNTSFRGPRQLWIDW